jgi:two-component system chemotaxis response regulator CheB
MHSAGQVRDLVVIGASAGGVEALKTVVSALPADLPATVLVALHVPATARSYLPDILRRRARMPVVEAQDDLPLTPGQIVAARPDAHLVVVGNHLVLGRGARENGARPAHDVMLRSAAVARGPRVVGAVLTGLLDDGAAGLATVARYGGACVVQNPADAEFPSMPLAALRAVPAAVVVPLAGLADKVAQMVNEPWAAGEDVPAEQHDLDRAEVRSALGGPPELAGQDRPGEPSPYACPDCHGVLNDLPDERVTRFRCRTGHAWTAESLVAQQDVDVEAALWTAMRVLEERAEMSEKLAQSAVDAKREWSQEHFHRRASEARESADLLRAVLRRESQLPSLPQVAAEP